MSVTTNEILTWCQTLLSNDASSPARTLPDYLAEIPSLDSLQDVPAGTPVLVRGDVDAKPGDKVGEGDIRLRSMIDTFQFGRERGWKMVVCGHIGRKPEGSLAKVAQRLGVLLDAEVPLINDWLDESSITISPRVTDAIERAAPGTVLVLENTRRYAIERVLWKATADEVPQPDSLTRLANEFAEKVATIYVNEAFSAGSLDSSTTVVPSGMQRVALGKYVAGEFGGPMVRCLDTQLVVFSGLKIDKLDDLEAMINRGTIRLVFTAGSLAMALRKAVAELDGTECCLGVAEHPDHRDKPYFIPAERIEQAKRMVSAGRGKNIRFVVPVDSVIADGSVVDELGPEDQQFDVGPRTSELFEEEIGKFLADNPAGAVAFHNGVFGMFEDPKFEAGTKRFVPQLKRLHDAGVEVYVGGGEGGKALQLYGQPEWVTHVFTAGGTVLNALGSDPVPYLVALRMAATRSASPS